MNLVRWVNFYEYSCVYIICNRVWDTFILISDFILKLFNSNLRKILFFLLHDK
jgi:hypothetical protein